MGGDSSACLVVEEVYRDQLTTMAKSRKDSPSSVPPHTPNSNLSAASTTKQAKLDEMLKPNTPKKDDTNDQTKKL
jgi:hypothetical protein